MPKPSKPHAQPLQREIQDIVDQIQAVLARIRGAEQPPSQLEIAELKALGEAYGKITAQLVPDVADDRS